MKKPGDLHQIRKKPNLTKTKRNVLFLLVDCLRADRCWGNGRTTKTPFINSFCENGTVFTQAIAVTSTTTPNVASIFTGVYSFIHGITSIFNYKLNPDVKTLAEIFKENGYNTYAEVTGPLGPETGLSKGFDEYHFRDKNDYVYSQWGEQLLEGFQNNEFKEPWFIFVHFWELHYPRKLPDESKSNTRFFRSVDRSLYERALSSLDAYLGKLLKNIDENTVIIFHADHGEKIAETMTQKYYFGLKNILSTLKRRLGLTEKGEILATIGHGHNIREYVVRVPLIFVGKKIIPEGKMIPNQVGQVDIFPTIIDALGLSIDDNPRIHGRSLMPLVRNEKMPEIPLLLEIVRNVSREKALPDLENWLAGVRTSKYKFIYAPYNDKIPEELYNLENDSSERRNIINKRPEIAQELREMLEEIYKEKRKKKIEQELSPEEEKKMRERLRKLGYL